MTQASPLLVLDRERQRVRRRLRLAEGDDALADLGVERVAPGLQRAEREASLAVDPDRTAVPLRLDVAGLERLALRVHETSRDRGAAFDADLHVVSAGRRRLRRHRLDEVRRIPARADLVRAVPQ